jgi:hypothetical protein
MIGWELDLVFWNSQKNLESLLENRGKKCPGVILVLDKIH